MAKVFKNLSEVSSSLSKGLELSNKQMAFEITNRALIDANKLTPINVKKGAKGGTLRNSGLAKSNLKSGELSWSTPYVEKMWIWKGKFSNSSSQNKWAEKSISANMSIYQKIITKIIEKNKLK